MCNSYLKMQHSVIKKVVLSIVHIIGIYCSSSERLKEKLRYLENRVNSESMLTDEDYAEIIDGLDEIDERLNVSLEQTVGVAEAVREVSDADLKLAEHLRDDFSRIKAAFGEERSETARARREIPETENDSISMKHDMDKYCMTNLNKVEQLTARVEEVYDFIKTDLTQQITKINAEQLALRSDINTLNKLKIQEFRTIAEQIEESVRNIVEKSLEEEISKKAKMNTAKVENIDMFVTEPPVPPKQFGLHGSCVGAKDAGSLRTGVYKLRNGHDVFCDQTTDRGGWTVFQRRQNGEVDFYRNWTEYKNGFGDLEGEFWLGNRYLSKLTADGDHELRIDMEYFDGKKAYAKYSKFKIYPEEDKYKLEVSGFSGNAGDSLEYHNGMAFSTYDNDNDEQKSGDCASQYHSAWWYGYCYESNLNGQYFNEPDTTDFYGIKWFHWKKYYSLKSVEMKCRLRYSMP